MAGSHSYGGRDYYGRDYYRYANDHRRWSGMGGALFSSFSAFLGIFLLITFFSVSVATGLFYLADLAEEHTNLSRKIISLLIKLITALHVMLLLVDGLPFLCVLCGVAAHILYYQLMRTYPYVDLGSYEFMGSLGAGIVSNLLWGRFFWQDPRCAYISLEWLLGFMVLMAWLVPFMFLVSLTTTSQALPMVSSGHMHADGESSSNSGESSSSSYWKKRRTTAISSLLRFVTNKRDQVLPTVMEQVSTGRKRRQV